MVANDIPDDSNERTDAKGLAAMTAQILNFPGQSAAESTSTVTAEDYAQVASRLLASATARGFDPMVLAGAIVAAVDTQEARNAAHAVAKIENGLPSLRARSDYGDASELSRPIGIRVADPVEAFPQPAAQSEHCDKFRGTKYDRDLDVVAIAKLLRKDLKAARATTLVMLPAHVKISVTTSRYSMGCSLTVRIKGLREVEKWIGGDYLNGRTPLYLAAREACTKLMEAYLRDNSDTMTDYYDVNFAGDVVVD